MTAVRGPVAALDCGTNSTRLLVADAAGSPLERLLTITRLGQGVDQTGALNPEAIERTLAALTRYREAMDRHGVVSARLVATSAARDAANYAEFARGAREVCGVDPELLEGNEEGALAFAGATAGMTGRAADGTHLDRLVLDIGGGSTELIAGVPEEAPGFVRSLDVGCVRVTERFLRHDPPLESELDAARRFVESLVSGVREEARSIYRSDAFDHHGLIGVAGTVTALCAMSLGLDEYDPSRVHHAILSRDEVSRLAAELASETSEQRRHHRSLEAGRADVIAAGALVLDVVMEALGFSSLLVSEADILDGLVASQFVRQVEAPQ